MTPPLVEEDKAYARTVRRNRMTSGSLGQSLTGYAPRTEGGPEYRNDGITKEAY